MEGGGNQSSGSQPANRGRGRGKSRGGLGKYLRARGRGRGRGRGAVWNERLVLEGEQGVEAEEEDLQELQRKYGKRQLASNADRYAELEPELDSAGEEVVEPEVDLSSFLARQRLQDDTPPPPEEDDDVDTTLSHHVSLPLDPNSKKGKVQEIQWDESLEQLTREIAAADAARDLKERFRAKTTNQRGRATSGKTINRPTRRERQYAEAPALPSDVPQTDKSEKEKMEDFLDDLLR